MMLGLFGVLGRWASLALRRRRAVRPRPDPAAGPVQEPGLHHRQPGRLPGLHVVHGDGGLPAALHAARPGRDGHHQRPRHPAADGRPDRRRRSSPAGWSAKTGQYKPFMLGGVVRDRSSASACSAACTPTPRRLDLAWRHAGAGHRPRPAARACSAWRSRTPCRSTSMGVVTSVQPVLPPDRLDHRRGDLRRPAAPMTSATSWPASAPPGAGVHQSARHRRAAGMALAPGRAAEARQAAADAPAMLEVDRARASPSRSSTSSRSRWSRDRPGAVIVVFIPRRPHARPRRAHGRQPRPRPPRRRRN